MTQITQAIRVEWLPSMAALGEGEWDALLAPDDFPFLRWRWLYHLERSGCVAEAAGWIPCHLTLRRGGRLAAAAPLYVKRHSQGEFVFDGIWSEAARRLGFPYYPKLVGMVPFTPVAGYRFLVAPGEEPAPLLALMDAAIDTFCREQRLGGCHLLHLEETTRRQLGAWGYSPWLHAGFLWRNRGFGSFDDYLATFKTDGRRNIRRDQRAVADAGIALQVLSDAEIEVPLLRRMYRLYLGTNAKFGPFACRYLNEDFFVSLADGFRRHLALVSATRRGRGEPLGMALLVHGGGRLYGRYWGQAQHHAALHFDCCYYAPIAWAIARGLDSFDPGMGGEHKVRRGFMSLPRYSLHRIGDPRLQRVMEAFLPEINRAEAQQIAALNRALPLRSDARRTGPPPDRSASA